MSSRFASQYGKHFFLGNVANVSRAPMRANSLISPHFRTMLKSSLFPLLPKSFKQSVPRQTIQIKEFHSTGMVKFIRVSNYHYKNNWDTLKRGAIFSGIFIIGTTLVTPYLFQLPPFNHFAKHPSHLVYGLIGLNVAVFGVWQLPKYWRLLNRYALLEKNSMYSSWSVIGSAFSHQEFWHLGVNMLALYSFGTSLAGMLGASNFTQLYLNSAAIASLASIAYPIIFKIPVTAPSLGASGALFGVFGAFSYLVPTAKIMLFVFPIPGGAWVAFLGSAVWNAAGCFMRWGSFDYAAHFGGSIAGVAYGWYFSKKFREARERRMRGAFRF